MTREKVIKGLECCASLDSGVCAVCDWADPEEYECFANLAKAALALLKEQEAVKPCVAVDTWICPKCGHALESQYLIDDKENPQVLVHEQYNFCPNCGKAVKWE